MKIYFSLNNEINRLFKVQNIEDIYMMYIYINVVAVVAGTQILTHTFVEH